ncbi:hypothetical protein FB645_002911 [Coemansia sp. IMI 203386]|nr:hypothetical protein FB645_002911 [Coemansia sp. IMI 203386]
MIFWAKFHSILFFAVLIHGACENPASFKKCVAQTRAEVNICGINMTCKCNRQESVVKCYDKCGDDTHYMRLKEGEKGQQQIFCSQKRPGEPEEMPIIGSDMDDSPKKDATKKNSNGGKKDQNKDKKTPSVEKATVPKVDGEKRKSTDDDGIRARKGTGGSVIKDVDVDGAMGIRGMADIGSIAFALAAVVVAGAVLV